MSKIVGIALVVGTLLACGAEAQAGLLRDTARTVVAANTMVAQNCEQSDYGLRTRCHTPVGPAAHTCEHGTAWKPGSGASWCAVSAGSGVVVGCENGNVEGTQQGGCYAIVGDVRLACTDSTTSAGSGQPREYRACVVTQPGGRQLVVPYPAL